MASKVHDLLYQSFERALTQLEQKRLDEALKTSETLRREKAVLERLRQRVTDSSVDTKFRPFFADRVMSRIRSQTATGLRIESVWEGIIAAFRPIAIAATVVMIVLISYNLFKSKTISVASALGEPDITLEQVVDPAFVMNWE
ncbi:hypothetical protein JW960_12290 [candidate division KSB1 bacterium]|nr:hypothetical protein [candidate division KSB1 bacterium]